MKAVITQTQDAIGRRSRFKRTPTHKRIVLGDRDTKILRWLYRYRYLRTPQLISFLQPKSQKRFVERLGDLFHETGLINRPQAQWRYFDPWCAPRSMNCQPRDWRTSMNKTQCHTELPHFHAASDQALPTLHTP